MFKKFFISCYSITFICTINLYAADEVVTPIKLFKNLDLRKVKLGNRLFHDVRLSKDNTISCSSCHNLTTAGVDRQVKPIGINQSLGTINTPTVFNAALNFKQFWDGRAETLEDQIDGPIQNKREMGSTWKEVEQKLTKIKYYKQQFQLLYQSTPTRKVIKSAIAIFERSLLTPNSDFDKFLKGNNNAISTSAKRGFQIFKEYGCSSCHQGVGIGGNMFQVFGAFQNYFDGKAITKADLGRFNVTHNQDDKPVFKVPSLRNIALTAPYFHDGSAKTLQDAIKTMGLVQLGRQLNTKDINDIKSFLTSLTGEYLGVKLE